MDEHIHRLPHDVAGSLEGLQVSADDLREAVIYGESERAACTANDPASLPGILQWGRTLRRLRELLAPQGWKLDRAERLECVTRDDGRVAIAVCMGDEHTGDATRNPSTKHPRGESIVEVIVRDNRQFRFGFDAQDARPSLRTIWVLLIHTTEEATFCELSVPIGVDRDRRLVRWARRIMLDPIVHEPDPDLGHGADDEDDIDFDVKRKAQ